jgi:Diaphanous FH3 Domain
MACDKHVLGEHIPKAAHHGHQAVSESLTTLRLRCAEPVRFRLLIGILNSGGGSGELQYNGIRFLNTFMDSAESLQTRLYLQAELYQAGLEPHQMTKLISSTSPWLQKLDDEIKRWDSIKIDIEHLQRQVRSAEQCRSKLVILERKVEMMQEEKNVFTSIERRLQVRKKNFQGFPLACQSQLDLFFLLLCKFVIVSENR